MNKEELKEYFERTKELEKKLTGEDKETIQWMIYGYNKCAKKYFETLEELDKYKNNIERIQNIYTSMQFSAPENMYVFIDQLGEVLEELKGE